MLQAHSSSHMAEPQAAAEAQGQAQTEAQEQGPKPLLEVRDLKVAFQSSTGTVPAVRKANFCIYPGQTIAIVGGLNRRQNLIGSAARKPPLTDGTR